VNHARYYPWPERCRASTYRGQVRVLGLYVAGNVAGVLTPPAQCDRGDDATLPGSDEPQHAEGRLVLLRIGEAWKPGLAVGLRLWESAIRREGPQVARRAARALANSHCLSVSAASHPYDAGVDS